jgi:hypothetical protein
VKNKYIYLAKKWKKLSKKVGYNEIGCGQFQPEAAVAAVLVLFYFLYLELEQHFLEFLKYLMTLPL